MKVSYTWLQKYFDKKLPTVSELADAITFHTLEVEGIEKVVGDSIIDIDILPNRSSDCLSHRGIAKDISVVLDIPLKDDPLRHNISLTPQSKILKAKISDEKLCRRFSGAVVTGVKIGPSPKWLKKVLEALGQKSINNVVDATNYAMFDLGQPLHAFDKGKLTEKDGGNLITVRTASSDEKITVLSGEEHKLKEDTLLITDGNSDMPIGIAGIKGGASAEIDETTTDLIIESANFHPTNIRKSSQFLKLRTDASARFENDVPTGLTVHGLTTAVKLILEIAGGELEGYVDVYPQRAAPYKVGVGTEEINKLLGTDLKNKEVEDILDRFGFAYKKVKPINEVIKIAPTLVGAKYEPVSAIRFDAPDTFSCSSLTNYIYVQAGMAIPSISVDQYVFGAVVNEKDLQPGDLVFSNSKNGTIHYETKEWMSGVKVSEGIDHVALYIGDGNIIHATARESSVVIEPLENHKDIIGYRRIITDTNDRYVITIPFERLDLCISEDVIEEVGRINGYAKINAQKVKGEKQSPTVNKGYYYAEKVRHILEGEGYSEVYTTSFRDHGEVELENALASDKSWLRADLREAISEGLEFNARNKDFLGLPDIKIFEIGTVFKKEGEHTSLSIGVQTGEKGKKSDTIVQKIIKSLSKELGTTLIGETEDGVFETNFENVVGNLPQPEKYDSYTSTQTKVDMYKPISVFPFVLRDIALWVSKEVEENVVLEAIKRKAGKLLVTTTRFDIFEKGDRKSYAFRLVFQSLEKTLSDEEVNSVMEKIEAALFERGWEVR